MVKILVINKHGQLKESSLKSSDRADLYKKAGFKKCDGFECRATWAQVLSGDKVEVELWSRDEGKAGTENKYDFPPPVDSTLYFGSCVLVRRDPDNQSLKDLSVETWSRMYDKLFGGFEDLDDDDISSDDELEGVPDSLKTGEGYLKDGFIRNDVGSDEEDCVSEDGEENIIMSRPRSRDNSDSEGDESTYDDYDTSELVPETYTYSDEE